MITLHHLRIGRSIFVVWLLEELGVNYELKVYYRDPQTMRAQDDLKAVHPRKTEDAPTAYHMMTIESLHFRHLSHMYHFISIVASGPELLSRNAVDFVALFCNSINVSPSDAVHVWCE